MLISEAYRSLNSELHDGNPNYGGTIKQAFVDMTVSALSATGSKTLLDYGCGKGWLIPCLEGHIQSGWGYDPAIPEKSREPDPADLVTCFDVMEHIEPECLDQVLTHIRSLALKAALFVIDTEPALKTLSDGRNAHLIQEGADWWLPKLEALYSSLNAGAIPTKDGRPSGLIYCLAST